MKLSNLHDGYDPSMSAQQRHKRVPPIKGKQKGPVKISNKRKKRGSDPLKLDSPEMPQIIGR